MDISTRFVEYWAGEYDRRRFSWTHTEHEIRQWLAVIGEPKYLNKRTFLLICYWQSGQMSSIVRSNHFRLIRKVTHLAYSVENDNCLKLRILQLLDGVDVMLASTILHFMQPAQFPAYNLHTKASLSKAGKWTGPVDDESESDWLDYLLVMRELSHIIGVDLQSLAKALWLYDKTD